MPLDEKEKQLVITSVDEYELKAVVDVLESKLLKRKVSLKALDKQAILPAGGSTVRQEIKLQQGIPIEKARDIVKPSKTARKRFRPLSMGNYRSN